MKILNHGNLKPRKFTCRYCGCEFVANAKEYNVFESWIYMYCPDCDTKTFDSELWEEQNESKTSC